MPNISAYFKKTKYTILMVMSNPIPRFGPSQLLIPGLCGLHMKSLGQSYSYNPGFLYVSSVRFSERFYGAGLVTRDLKQPPIGPDDEMDWL